MPYSGLSAKRILQSDKFAWDIEMIGNIRDSLVNELQNELGINEFDIYP